MFAPSVHLIVRQCQSQWRSRVFRNILIQHQRQLTSKSQEKKDDGKVVVQSTTSTLTDSTQRKSVVHLNPKVKRNLRGKRRATGIRPDEVSLASAINDVGKQEEKTYFCFRNFYEFK